MQTKIEKTQAEIIEQIRELVENILQLRYDSQDAMIMAYEHDVSAPEVSWRYVQDPLKGWLQELLGAYAGMNMRTDEPARPAYRQQVLQWLEQDGVQFARLAEKTGNQPVRKARAEKLDRSIEGE